MSATIRSSQGRKRSKSRRAARGGPGLLGQRGRAGDLLDQRPRQPDEPVVLPPERPDVDGGGRGGIGQQVGALDRREQLAEPRVGAAVVQQPGDERELLAPVLDPAGRHVGLLVPLEQRFDGGEERSPRARAA